MNLLTKPILAKLRKNADLDDDYTKPVVKLFGGAACTWLLSELDNEGIAFGLCDLGFGTPELGSVSIAELEALRFPPFNLPVERDKYWVANKSISEYAEEARILGYICALN